MSAGRALAYLASTEVPSHDRSDWLWTASLNGSHRPAPTPSAVAARQVAVRLAGELFDRDALARELSMKEEADTKLVSTAYSRWGLDAFAHLRGQFVVAVVDDFRRRILVARDPTGLHPLFYARHGDHVSFAESPRMLLRVPGVPQGWNVAAMADSLCHRHPDIEETLFRAVRRVPPGHVATIENGTMSVRRYWTPFLESGRERHEAGDELERFDALQGRAVLRCVKPGRTAIFLSGGLDSVSVACRAADQATRDSSRNLLALSLTLPHQDCDESGLQSTVARKLGLDQHVMGFDEALGPTNLAQQSLTLNGHLSSPLQNFWFPTFLALARAGRDRGAHTVLTGTGGDEFVSASPYFVADRLRRGDVFGALRFARAWKLTEGGTGMMWSSGVRPLAGVMLAKVVGPQWTRRRADRLVAGDPAWLAPGPGLKVERISRAEQSLRMPANLDLADADTEGSLTHTHAQHEREEFFELGRTIGIQFLHPYCDPDLISLVCRVPLSVLNYGGRLRGLLRRQLAARFPEAGFDRQRKVFATRLFHKTLVTALSGLNLDALVFPALSDLGVVDGILARHRLMSDWPNPTAAARIWDLLNLETWILKQEPSADR